MAERDGGGEKERRKQKKGKKRKENEHNTKRDKVTRNIPLSKFPREIRQHKHYILRKGNIYKADK